MPSRLPDPPGESSEDFIAFNKQGMSSLWTVLRSVGNKMKFQASN